MNWDYLLGFALTSAASIAWTTLQAGRPAAAEATGAPSRRSRGGIGTKRRVPAEMSTLWLAARLCRAEPPGGSSRARGRSR